MNDRDMTLPPYWRVNHYVCMLSKDFEIDVSDINFFEEEIKSVESEGQLLQMNVNDQWVPHLIKDLVDLLNYECKIRQVSSS